MNMCIYTNMENEMGGTLRNRPIAENRVLDATQAFAT